MIFAFWSKSGRKLFYLYFRPILFVGPTGTGKSVYVQDKLMNGLSKDKYLPAFVNFSAQTSANQTQVTNNGSIWNVKVIV